MEKPKRERAVCKTCKKRREKKFMDSHKIYIGRQIFMEIWICKEHKEGGIK
ncbi:MAG: hypothetical protein [Wigfec virus K19_94]|nr:MAG: hypothetical protein [Wigfec virus K19_94]